MCYIYRTGTGDIILGYNGRDGVVTDTNGLCYMRARYYSPDMRRFINADIIAGKISNAVTLNRYAYANGNPVSNVDPFGLSAERGNKNASFNGRRADPSYPTILELMKNPDGTYSLYDNLRFNPRSKFHEQMFSFKFSGPYLNAKDKAFGLGSFAFDEWTGGWESEYVDFSLFDFFHLEATAEMKDGHLSLGALASLWSPSLSFKIGNITIEIGAEIGAIGRTLEVGPKGFEVGKSDVLGFNLSVTW